MERLPATRVPFMRSDRFGSQRDGWDGIEALGTNEKSVIAHVPSKQLSSMSSSSGVSVFCVFGGGRSTVIVGGTPGTILYLCRYVGTVRSMCAPKYPFHSHPYPAIFHSKVMIYSNITLPSPKVYRIRRKHWHFIFPAAC